MSRFVLLDCGPLSAVAHPRASKEIRAWCVRLDAAGVDIAVPEIADYEVRRELIRARKDQSIERLDLLLEESSYLPISTPVMRRAAQLWATARQAGRPTAPDLALDADVILAAFGQLLREDGHDVVVATTNVDHIGRYIAARRWQDIDP